jgi:6-phosphofructokinase 1
VIKRIGILTGGGDAPGLNAVIRAAVLTANRRYGWEVIGIREGFDGLLNRLPILTLNENNVRELLARGGTVLGAANRGSPFARKIEKADGSIETIDVSHEALERFHELDIDALIVAGGDGTMAIAQKLVEMGAPIVGVPKTIDNDLSLTDVTFGFDTAISTATEALDRLQTTAESHHRAMILEVMGRNAGWIALKAGIAGGADAILIPEIPFDINIICDKIKALRAAGRRYSLIVVAEGAAPVGGEQQFYIQAHGTMEAKLGGISYEVGNLLSQCADVEVRVTVLGHLQRGGQPTPHDRWLATRFGSAAVHLAAAEQWGYMVALHGEALDAVPMADAINLKLVDVRGELIQMGRDLGIVFG